MTAPIIPDKAVTASPMNNEVRAPNSVRENTSRPNWSVPNGLEAEGGRNLKRMRMAVGLASVKVDAKAARRTISRSKTKPALNEE